MHERDKLITKNDPDNKLYIVTPTPMMEWMEIFRQNDLRYPEMVVLVPSNTLNPEKEKYYQQNEEIDRFSTDKEKHFYKKSEIVNNPVCQKRDAEEIEKII